MAPRPIAGPPRRTGLRTIAGLPTAALAAMVGVVLVVNAHLFGWPGVAGGGALTAGGIALGIRCFRPRPVHGDDHNDHNDHNDDNRAAAGGRPDSGEHRA